MGQGFRVANTSGALGLVALSNLSQPLIVSSDVDRVREDGREVQESWCCEFDGAGQCVALPEVSISNTSGYVWVKPTAFSSNSKNIISWSNTVNYGLVSIINNVVRVMGGVAFKYVDHNQTPLSLGKWYKIAWRIQPGLPVSVGINDVWVDGPVIASMPVASMPGNKPYIPRLGASYSGDSRFWFVGKMVGYVGLSGQYNLQEKSGTVAIDSSGAGNHGTLVGGVTRVADAEMDAEADKNNLEGCDVYPYFNGINSWVDFSYLNSMFDSVSDSIRLTLKFTTTSTLEAVYSNALFGVTRGVTWASNVVRICVDPDGGGIVIGHNTFTSGVYPDVPIYGLGFNDDKLHTLDVTLRQGDAAIVIVDGVDYSASNSYIVDMNTSDISSVTIGAEYDTGGPSDHFLGIIDDVNIYVDSVLVETYDSTSKTNAGNNVGNNVSTKLLPNADRGSIYPVSPARTESSALKFDGTNYVRVAKQTLDGTFSGSLWFKHDAGHDGERRSLLEAYDSSGVNEWYGGHIAIEANNALNIGGTGGNIAFHAPSIGVWHFLEWDINAISSWAILDGHRIADYRPLVIESREGYHIGTYRDANARFFYGEIADVKINGTHIPFTEGVGSLVHATDGTTVGTLVGGPTWVQTNDEVHRNLDAGFTKALYQADGDSINLGTQTIGSNVTWQCEGVFQIDIWVNFISFLGLGNWSGGANIIFYDDGKCRSTVCS